MGLVMIFNTTSAEVLDLALSKSTHQAFSSKFYMPVPGLGCCRRLEVGLSAVHCHQSLFNGLFQYFAGADPDPRNRQERSMGPSDGLSLQVFLFSRLNLSKPSFPHL